MPKPKRTPAQPAAEPPAPAAAQPQQTGAPSLTSLLQKCFRFDADADNESRQLLFDILERFETGNDTFPVAAAYLALAALGVHAGVDDLENPKFLELMNLFSDAVTGFGYGGFREQLIAQLLRKGDKDMKFDRALAILAIEFQQKNANISAAREALKEYPEELADAIEKAMESSPELRGRIASKLNPGGAGVRS
jgi:hypothetical protein